jgi:sugar-specific transcriptional regulator TrmB
VISRLTQEWILEILAKFGLKRQDAEVYVYLAENGPKNAKDIVLSLKTSKPKVYRSLRKLQNKKIVKVIPKHPNNFSVVSIDKLLDLLAKSSLEEAQRIEHDKDRILRFWKTNVKHNSTD